MDERVYKCPQCRAPIAPPSRWARSAVCSFCGTSVQIDPTAVSAAHYRAAYQAWNEPSAHGFTQWWSHGETHWAPEGLIARGELSDVYLARRARWPTERVLLKVLRDSQNAALLEHEWEVLEQLQDSSAQGAASFTLRLPQPVARGQFTHGPHAGRHVLALRWTSGFVHTFEAVRSAWPSGIPPGVSVWMWRRILESLSFIHRSGFVHGAVLPPHLLVQHHEHGVKLVGFACAQRQGNALRALPARFESFYPEHLLRSRLLTPEADLEMSARCIAAVLGGDPSRGTVPATVPAALAALVRQVATGGWRQEAWTLREHVGEVGRAAFGPPSFHPLEMP